MAALAVLAAWLLFVGAHHEPWADEAQAWLLARDNGLVDLLVDKVRYEGTPGLWYVLLWVLVHCGWPFDGLYLISVSCAITGAALVLWRSPFPPLLRLVLVGSYFFSYQYAVVARSYALDLVLLPALAIVFQERTKRPIAYGLLVGLLSNCNTYSFLLATLLGLEWLLTLIRAQYLRRASIGLVISILLGFGALLVALQPADNGFLQQIDMHQSPLAAAVSFVFDAFVDRPTFWSFQRPTPLGVLSGFGISIALLLPTILLFLRAGTLPLIAISCAVLIGFSGLVYASPWHAGLLFLTWLFGLWISWRSHEMSPLLKPAVVFAIAAIGIVQTTEAVRTGIWDINNNYSAGKDAAQAIALWKSSHPRGRIAAANFKTFSVQPYFSKNIFANYYGGADQPSYVVWKRNAAWQPFQTETEAQRAVAGNFDLLILSDFAVSADHMRSFKRMASEAGYELSARFLGQIEWKGYKREDSTLLFFTKRTPVE